MPRGSRAAAKSSEVLLQRKLPLALRQWVPRRGEGFRECRAGTAKQFFCSPKTRAIESSVAGSGGNLLRGSLRQTPGFRLAARGYFTVIAIHERPTSFSHTQSALRNWGRFRHTFRAGSFGGRRDWEISSFGRPDVRRWCHRTSFAG